jgi:esterase/lipase superfamily enzyme
MGNYLVQKAMQTVWTRKNQPLLMSLINQLVMVAADVDNDLFRSGEVIEKGDGDAIANLTYRVTALYTGLDSTLGVSAGLKHFGKRRLGRSGLDNHEAVPDNVWHADCTEIFRKAKAGNIHSAYFDVARTQELLVSILRGVDRSVLMTAFPELA